MIEFVGIGDLHLDSGLRQYIPDFNQFVCDEIRKVLDYARRNSIQLAVLYGDICHKPTLTSDAIEKLLVLLGENKDINFIFLKGNHDHATDQKNSLTVFKSAVAAGLLPNLKVVDTPVTLFKKSGTPIRLLPWPHTDTDPDCLNVLHIEVDGSVWDGGRKVTSDFTTDHICVAGHLHTRQRVGNVNFSGTLYQTSFGEKPKKFFHHVTLAEGYEPSIKCVRHVPAYTLVNLVVSERADLEKIEDDPHVLYKVFVSREVDLDPSDLAKDNIVKHNFYSNKDELNALIQTELQLDDESWSISADTEHFLSEWLQSSCTDTTLAERAREKYLELAVKLQGNN